MPTTGPIFAIADDLTGALEVGVKLNAIVSTNLEARAGALVIDTESRHLSPAAAADRVSRALDGRELTNCLFYKKTDSTLRGNIASELRAITRAFPGRRIGYAGAYPKLGRTVRNGVLYVGDTPVHQTAFAHDPLNPVVSSSLAEVLAGVDCVIYDGETCGDVERAACEIRSHGYLAAGPSAIAGALGTPANGPLPQIRSALIVNGSLHPASIEQIDAAARRGLPEGWKIESRTATDPAAFEALIVFGGDTAFEITRALGVETFEPLREILPGVPLSRMNGPTPYLITKAGGYGANDLLCRLIDLLHHQ